MNWKLDQILIIFYYSVIRRSVVSCTFLSHLKLASSIKTAFELNMSEEKLLQPSFASIKLHVYCFHSGCFLPYYFLGQRHLVPNFLQNPHTHIVLHGRIKRFPSFTQQI